MSVLGTAASLAKKKAELAALNNVTLPRVYQSIGRKIAGLAKLPPALAEQVTRIRQLEAAVAAGPVDSPATGESGFAAKAKQLAQKAAKATADAATGIQITSAYMTLGREAVRQFGEKAVPKEYKAEFTTLNAQQESLTAEIKQLEETHSGGIVTPKRLVLAGMLVAVLFGGVVLIRGVGSLLGSGAPKAPDWRESVSSRRESRRNEELPPDLQAAIADAKEQKRERTLDFMKQELESVFGTWRSKADDEVEPLHDDYRVASDYSDLTGATRDSFDAAAKQKLQALKESRSSSETRLQESMNEYIGRFRVAAEGSTKGSDVDSLRQDLVEEFRAECDADVERLQEARTRATEELGRLAREPEEKRKRLQESLAADLTSIVAEWAKGISPLASLKDEKQLPAPSGLQDQDGWRQEYDDTVRNLIAVIDGIIENQRRQAVNLAESTAAAVLKGEAEPQARRGAQDNLKTLLVAAGTEAKAARSHAIERLTKWHASTMKQQMDREEAERAAKEFASRRTYEGPVTLTDDELIEVIRLAPDISDLALAQSVSLTDKCMPAIASLKNLRELYLSNRAFHTDTEPAGITAKGLSLLKGKKLKRLTIPDRLFNTDAGFLAYVHSIADIRSCEVYWRDAGVLRLDNARVSEAVLQELLDVPHIFGLTLPGRISDRGLEVLQKFPELQRVDFFLTDKVTDAGLRSLAKCKNLKMVIMWLPDGVVDVPVSPEAVQALSGMNLAWFVVPRAMHTEQFFEPVLNTLSPVEVQFRDGEPLPLMRKEVCLVSPKKAFDPQIAANNPDRLNREVFSMWHWPCTPAVLRACEGKNGIQDLEIRECSVDEDALASVGLIPDLKKLLILQSDVSGKGLRTIGQAKSLEEVEINQCPNFSGDGVAGLAQCVALERLVIVDAPLLNDEDLLKLAKCKTLKVLAVSGSQASNALLVKLQNLMPECSISINP